jgi:(p)ppGpp synthase/HD superfamily hydrolase
MLWVLQVDSLRMMLLGMVNDPRVVLIKLADRLHNMRTMYSLHPEFSHCGAAFSKSLAFWGSRGEKLCGHEEANDCWFNIVSIKQSEKFQHHQPSKKS